MKNLFYELKVNELKSKCGIYMISCKDHKYVGSSKSLYSRLREHRGDMLLSNHSNSFVQSCYNKYGASEIYYSILEFCNPEDRVVKEAVYIKQVGADMNMQDPVTRILSETSKKKISISLKKAYAEGRKATKESSPIEMYDLYGNFIKEYINSDEAAKENGVTGHTIQIAASRYYAGRLCGLKRFRYKFSVCAPKKFSYIKPQVITSRFEFVIVEPNGNITKIRSGVKHINQAIVDQLLKGNTEFKIKGNPKVPFKSGELLEQSEKANQQPS